MSERWRCFVALPISDELRVALADAVASWRERPALAALRWTDPGSWHVTLAFLGSVDADAVSAIGTSVQEVAGRHTPVLLRGGGLGAVPSSGRATVAWYGILDSDGSLERLARHLRTALSVEEERPFRAHATLARTRGGPVDMRAFLASEPALSMAFRPDRIELMRSHLGRDQARYEVIETAPLGAAAHV